MMRYALALLIAVVTLSGGLIAQPDTTVVTGTLYGPNMRPLPSVEFKVIRIVKSGYVYTWGPATYRSNSSGVVSFPVPRNSTAYVYCEKIPLIDKDQRNGHAVTIPNTATATLQAILPAATVPANYIVAVPGAGISVEEDSVQVADTATTINFVGSVSVTEYPAGTVTVNVSGGTGDTTGTTNRPEMTNIENDVSRALAHRTLFGRLTAALVIDSTTPGRYVLSLNPDSVAAWLVDVDTSMVWMLARIVQLPDSGQVERGYMTPTMVRTLLAGYSVTGHTHAIGDVSGLATALGDTASYRTRMTNVEAAIKTINDTLTAVSLRATSAKNDLAAHVGTADAHLPSQTGANGKFLQSNGTVSSWQTAITAESDPTVALRIRDSLALYNLGIMRGDSAALTKVLDMIYPRSGGGAGLTKWDESDTSATQASRTLKPKAFTANVNAVIRPLGTGAFIVGPAPDGTSTGGNARGTYAVDLQVVRAAAAAVASGGYSTTSGYNNTASQTTAVALGYGNAATGVGSVAIGQENTASGQYAVAMAYGSTASGAASGVFGGASNTASSTRSATLGGIDLRTGDSATVAIGIRNDTTRGGMAGVPMLYVGNGTGAGTGRSNALVVYKDGSLQSTSYTRNIVTVGAGDSVVVTGLQNMLPTDAVTLAYQAGKTAHNAGETILSYAIYSTTTLTIYGVENRKVAWIRMR